MSKEAKKFDVVPPFEGWKERQKQIQEVLSECKEMVDEGKVYAIMVYVETSDGNYVIKSSGCENQIASGGVLMKLGLMRLGFSPDH